MQFCSGLCVCALHALYQEGIVVAAEGIDKSGKGVLRMTLVPLMTKTGPRELDSQEDGTSTSLRIPVDALEMTGFDYADNDKVESAPKERRRRRAEKRLSKGVFLESSFLLCLIMKVCS